MCVNMKLDVDEVSCMDGHERFVGRRGRDVLIARTDALVVSVCDVGQESHRT